MKYKGFYNQVNELTYRECIVGNSLDIAGISCKDEIRKDIEIQHIEHINIWGQIKDDSNQPVAGECVRLIRIHGDKENEKLEMIKTMITDELGYYNFAVYGKEGERYTVLVDYQMLNPKVSSSSAALVKGPICLATAKHKCISDYIKFSK